MQCFEIDIALVTKTERDGSPISDPKVMYSLPPVALDTLRPILRPYGQDACWYFDKINYGRPPAPWSLVCLDREYAISGHVAYSRTSDLPRVGFGPYSQYPDPVPEGYVPEVGVLSVLKKAGLERNAARSPLFEAAWNVLRERSTDKNWLVVLDPLSESWLSEVMPIDRKLWSASQLPEQYGSA